MATTTSDSLVLCKGLSKHFAARAGRHGREPYGAVIDETPGADRMAFMEVHGKRERLVMAHGDGTGRVELSGDTYILSPCFAGSHLFWVEQTGKDWCIRAVPKHDASIGNVVMPFDPTGRPQSLAACRGRGEAAWLTWEERIGKKTRVRTSAVQSGTIGPAIDVTDGSCNAYDPSCCVTSDDELIVVYTAFRHGQYVVELQVLDADGQRMGDPQRIGNQLHPSLYPSVCARTEGGVWFSYVSFDDGYDQDRRFLQHHRFRGQRACFRSPGCIYAGAWHASRLWAPLAGSDGNVQQGAVQDMRVHGSHNASRSRVFEDEHGTPGILFRRHAVESEITYDVCDAPLARSARWQRWGALNRHPTVSVTRLERNRWSDPVCLISDAYVDGPITCRLDGRVIRFAFQQDSRSTGYATAGEWFDHDGQLAVGTAAAELAAGDAPAPLLPFNRTPVPTPSIENPPLAQETVDGRRVAMGQTHTHTNLSICVRAGDRDIDFNYRFSQDVQHSDFCGTTDHAYNMWHAEMLQTRKKAEYYYFPGVFVAIPAYEWTGSGASLTHDGGPWGHLNPLYLEEEGDLEFYTPCDPTHEGGGLKRTWQRYHGKQIVMPPHHVADNIHAFKWEDFDPEFAPVIELFQDARGSGEQEGAPGVTNFIHVRNRWAVPELLRGRRFGFIAGGDHLGIAQAGLWVTDLTRTGLYEAFMARRTFGTTGLAMTVDFRCNEAVMGMATQAEHAEFRFHVRAPEPLAELHVVRNGETVETVACDACEIIHEWSTTRQADGEFWYARVVLANGEMAWASPIWLTNGEIS